MRAGAEQSESHWAQLGLHAFYQHTTSVAMGSRPTANLQHEAGGSTPSKSIVPGSVYSSTKPIFRECRLAHINTPSFHQLLRSLVTVYVTLHKGLLNRISGCQCVAACLHCNFYCFLRRAGGSQASEEASVSPPELDAYDGTSYRKSKPELANA